jgi:general secretion pathway protein G
MVKTNSELQGARWWGGGFTLIDLLVVLAVIAILAALVAPNVFRHLGTAKDTSARSQIEILGGALDAYRLDNGRYPTEAQGLEAQWTAPIVDPRSHRWGGPNLRGPIPLDPADVTSWDRPE